MTRAKTKVPLIGTGGRNLSGALIEIVPITDWPYNCER